MRPRSRSGPGTSRVYVRDIDRSVGSPPPDLAFGAFSERAPWVVELDKLPWRRGVVTERARTRASIPRLLRPGRVPPMGRLLLVVSKVGPAVGPAMAWLARKLVGRTPIAALANPPAIVELFTETVVEELDFRLEADNMLDIAHVLALTDQRTIVVPRPHPTLVTRRVLVMERLRGFAFDDVKSMHEAGIDTEAVLRAGLVAFLEGAMLYGVFHGDLHGGNLFVQRDGRTALVDFGITGRLDEPKRLSFLRLLVTGTSGDVRGQLTALRDLGAFPRDTDLDAVIRDLRLDEPVTDPTTMSAEELIGELSDITQKLLGYGARIPKELMLFVKNLLFLNSATATLAPDIDILAQITQVSLYFAQRYGERIVREIGIDPTEPGVDMDAVKAGFGLPAEVEHLTFRDLQDRRQTILRRMQERERPRRRRGSDAS